MDGGLGTVGVIGAGLIGASVGMALTAAGVEVLLRDRDPEQARVAAARRAGRLWQEGERVRHAVIAVPPHAVADVLADVQRTGAAETASDVASVKAQVVAEARELGCALERFCPAHPVAGRERGGAISAQLDLFRDRPWAICPVPETGAAALHASQLIASLCGASHLHSRARASRSADGPALPPAPGGGQRTRGGGGEWGDRRRVAPGGHGACVTPRGSPTVTPDFGRRSWRATGSRSLPESIGWPPRLWGWPQRCGRETTGEVYEAVNALLGDGRRGRRKLPTKLGQPAPIWAWVGVVVPDRTGELARLLDAVGSWSINVEDVRLEHSTELRQGVAELAVQPQVSIALTDLLREAGWRAYQRKLTSATHQCQQGG